MANRITHEFNSVLNHSGMLSDFYTKQYLMQSSQLTVDLRPSDLFRCDSIDMYYRLSGFELFGGTEENAKKISDVAAEILGFTATSSRALSYSIYNHGQVTKMFFGTNHDFATQIKNAISRNLPNASISNEWIPSRELLEVQQYNGILVGVSQLEAGEIDSVLNSLQLENYLLSVVLIPVPQTAVSQEISNIHTRLDELQRVSRRELSFGTNRVRRADNDIHDILDIAELLKKETRRLEKGRVNGLWYVAVYISSDQQISYYTASSMVTALFRRQSNVDQDVSFSQLVQVPYAPVTRDGWRIPTVFLGANDLGGIYSNSLLNICDLSTASSLVRVPMHSHAGYSVKHYGESSAAAGAFDQYPTMPDGESRQFCLGKTDNGNDYMVSLDALRQHAFITGATQFGKSTSIRKIITEAAKSEVPFVVIEAAKKEYWELKKSPGLERLEVYSSGRDAKELTINPFQPEDNTILDAHIQNLVQAFLSLFDEADPLPQILTKLVYTCYEEKGWDVSRRVRKNSDLKYPVLSDMLANLDECVNSIGYSEEIKNNMKGVIRIRITSLIRQAGSFLNTRENLSIAQMFTNSAIIELDDYVDRNKPFIASLIAIKASEYSRQSMTGRSLMRLLVIEEAHHIIPNPEQKSVSPNAALCSKYFSNMLAEVSAYGTGVVIVDQRPSAVSSAAIANTGFKLIHNLREGTDVDVASASLSLKGHEVAVVPHLRVGEALVTVPQTNEVSRIKVDGRIPKDDSFNLGLLFGQTCDRDVRAMITDFDINILRNRDFEADAISSCIRNIQDRELQSLTFNECINLAGELIGHAPYNDMIKRQRIYEVVKAMSDRREIGE